MPKSICETDGCDEEISEGTGTRGGLPICAKCRHVQYYWKKQGPKAFAHRRETLNFWVGRLDYLSAHVGRLIKEAKHRVSAARDHATQRMH